MVQHLKYSSLDSTQLEAHRYLAQQPSPREGWVLITAEQQAQGRGQHGRSWVSPPGGNLYATYIIPWRLDHHRLLPHVAQVVTLAVCMSLEAQGVMPQIKWVNDLFLNRRKLGGVLCEFAEEALLIGIGLNVRTPPQALQDLSQPATSLVQETAQDWLVDDLLSHLTPQINAQLTRLQKEGFEKMAPDINARLAFRDECIILVTDQKHYSGICRGVSPTGGLLLERDSGTEDFRSGRIFVINTG